MTFIADQPVSLEIKVPSFHNNKKSYVITIKFGVEGGLDGSNCSCKNGCVPFFFSSPPFFIYFLTLFSCPLFVLFLHNLHAIGALVK